MSSEELRSELLRLCPIKIDIGAVYNAKPKDKKGLRPGAFLPVERELVFDIDMTDYDSVRSCCREANICRKCWEFMTISIKVLDRALKDDFGFEHRLWVYSGRRGVHCWVADARARKLSAEARKAIVNYLEVVRGGEDNSKKVQLSHKSLHKSLRLAYDVVDPAFVNKILKDQDILKVPEAWAKLLAFVPDDDARSMLDNYWRSHPDEDPLIRWDQVLNTLKDVALKKPNKKSAINNTPIEIVLNYSYPRLDSNVSVGLNHLLKSPFCVHPKTGRVCVPIDPITCEDFDPLGVPTIFSLIDEINNFDKVGENNEHIDSLNDFDKTSLKPYVSIFKSFVKGLDGEAREMKRLRHEARNEW